MQSMYKIPIEIVLCYCLLKIKMFSYCLLKIKMFSFSHKKNKIKKIVFRHITKVKNVKSGIKDTVSDAEKNSTLKGKEYLYMLNQTIIFQ